MGLFAGRYNELLFVDRQLAPNTDVTVNKSGSSVGASIYTDRNKANTLPTSVVRSDSAGNLAFYSDPGYYDIVYQGIVIQNILVPVDFLTSQDVPFSVGGTLNAATSPPWRFKNGARVEKVVAALGTAGTSNTVITLNKNGVAFGTVTLGPGVTFTTQTFNELFNADSDYLTVSITTAGSGAANLMVEVRV